MISRSLLAALSTLLVANVARAYPTDPDAQERTQIRRLLWQHKVNAGEVRGRKVPPGAQWPSARIELRLTDNPDFALTPETEKDPELQAALEEILKRSRFRRYNVVVLDISDPKQPRFAGVNETDQQTPGSVAKLLVASGLLNELAKRFPDDTEAREKLLREHRVAADGWAMPNHHEVPVIKDEEATRVSIRRVHTGDAFSLWEWMDHALSPSSNASASMLWREATLMHLMGEEYPPAEYGEALYRRWDRDTWTAAAFETLRAPIVAAGLDPDAFYLRMFFTKGANRYIKAESSRASPLGIAAWMVKVEQGKMVDAWASAELKKMLYLTRRRVRYLYTKALDEHAAYFKSGSLFQCKPEPGFTCIQYQGNVVNVLNALVEIETAPPAPLPAPDDPAKAEAPTVDAKEDGSPDQETKPDEANADNPSAVAEAPTSTPLPDPEHVYIVSVMSNELKRNAAMDHARLAEQIHAAITTPPGAKEE